MARKSLRQDMFTALTGLAGDVSGKAGDLRAQLLAIGGRSTRTKSGIDLTRAAAELGVTRRTVERWVKHAGGGHGGMAPSPKRAGQITRKAQSRATTKRGRAATVAMSPKAASLCRHGGQISMEGNQGPYDPIYRRYRITRLSLSGSEMQDLFGAYESGGDTAALQWLSDFWGPNYMKSQRSDSEPWSFDADDITISIRDLTRRGVH